MLCLVHIFPVAPLGCRAYDIPKYTGTEYHPIWSGVIPPYPEVLIIRYRNGGSEGSGYPGSRDELTEYREVWNLVSGDLVFGVMISGIRPVPSSLLSIIII